MRQVWGALADQPARSVALTDALLKMQRSVEVQGTRHDSTPPNGHEEALTQFVEELSNTLASDIAKPPKLLRRFRSLGRNRSRREQSRQRQLQAMPPYRVAPLDPAVVAETKDLLEAARSRMPQEDWALFEARSRGLTFDEIARHTGASSEALRRRASRHRAALRCLIT